MKKMITIFMAVICGAFVKAQHSPAEQAARQARSVHLYYNHDSKSSQVFYIEGTVRKAYIGTYVCFIGFNAGYCGLQRLRNGEHRAIFSIWEPSDPFDFSANPDVVQEASRTRNLYYSEGVEVSRFGGEGTGGRSMMPLNWREGEKVRMAISCGKDGDHRTAYTCWIYADEFKAWFRMATFSSLVGEGKAEITNAYSFVEDFLRNVESRDHARVAEFSRLWAYDGKQWHASSAARFSADSNALTNIDAGPAPAGFWMATGGKTENKTVKLWETFAPGQADMDDSESYRNALIEAVQSVDAPPALPTQG